jgi:hypothetical protein
MERRTQRYVLAALVVVVAAVYAKAVGFGQLYGFDDQTYLFNRPEVEHWWAATWWQRLTTPSTGYGIPVPTFIYAHLRWLFPDLYVHTVHALSVILHCLNVVLVFALARRWATPKVALVVAAFWGLHPVQVESVAWATNLKNLLYAGGVLGAALVWDKYLADGGNGTSQWRAAGLVTLLYLVALGSRPEAVLMPLFLAVVTLVRERDWRTLAELRLVGAIQVAVAAAYLPTALAGQAAVVDGLGSASVGARLLRIAAAFQVSVSHLVFPLDLDPAYYLRPETSTLRGVTGGVALVATVLVGVGLFVRRRWRLLAGVAFAAVAYAPYSQLYRIPRLTADTYLYLPSVGAVFAAVVAARQLLDRRIPTDSTRPRRALVAVALGAAAMLGLGTHSQLDRWRNPVTLWKPVLADELRVWRPYAHLAEGYMKRGDWKRAAGVLEAGLPIFRKSAFYPEFMPMVIERVGHPRKAWELAVEALQRDRSPEPFHYQVYLGLLVRHDLTLPDDENLDELTRRAVEVMTDREDWMGKRQMRLPMASYFVRQGRSELASPFVRRELQADRSHCAVWRLAEQTDELRSQLDVPERPARCPKRGER